VWTYPVHAAVFAGAMAVGWGAWMMAVPAERRVRF
jgi:hypothetical protein